ncbi:MAG: ArsR family transcriptional regulator [Halobacteriaceae archaeon]
MIHEILEVYNLVLGILAGVGLLYLLYVEEYIVGYKRSLLIMTSGLLIFSIISPLVQWFVPQLVHLIHAIAALLIIFGLYDPVHNDLRRGAWANLLLRNPTEIRNASDWMQPIDDQILELFHSTDLVLTPSIIAYNIDYSREETNRRLTKLANHDMVEKVDRGKYRITELGQQYLEGPLSSTESLGEEDKVTIGEPPS